MGQDVARPAVSGDAKDENRLAQFGYKQELHRDWGLAHNFGISFSIIVRLFSLSLSLSPRVRGVLY